MKPSTRKEVLVSKVLARLYPADVSYSSSSQRPTLQSEIKTTQSTPPEDVEILQSPTESSPGSEKGPPNNQKVYTVSLPPDDYVPSSQNDCRSSNSEHSENSEDTEGNNPRLSKRRRRKKKARSSPQVVAEGENNIHPPILPLQTSVHINKNKRRKLQRKRQKERLKAAGLWPKVRASVLIDQPERCDEQAETLNCPDETIMEEEMMKKSGDLLDFLEATQEIYFTDSKSRCETDALSLDVILETLNQIKSRKMPSSDVTALHHLKTLVLLQDIERLKESLESFKEHSSLPIDHKMVLCSLFYYWITDILPMRKIN
ncbi:glutamate-rich protein 1 [Spea bombifrons]|uniref:glutamate-rich protein 1 n=1 Tax=Spea bombifrons TaxID=233779 RepID=UPI00234AB51C|nr:glutamate-rich protein 1 [Spea bombifrons]